MNDHSLKVFQLTKRRAAFRLRQLLDEIQMLTAAFPDLRDAFDADELPVAFILKRDSRRSEPQFKRPTRSSEAANRSGTERLKTNRTGTRKQPADR